MTILITPPVNVEELASFLATMNREPSSNVGYCGVDKDEILHTLRHDFSDLELANSFAVAYENERIVGAIGLDIEEDDLSAEVWGPFIKEGFDYFELGKSLWEQVNSYSTIKLERATFFLHKENTDGKEFILKIGGVEGGHHYILKAYRNKFIEDETDRIEQFNDAYELSFSALHEANFPNTYYNAQKIISRLNEKNQLLIMKGDNNDSKGYVYVEADPEHGGGSIEYIAVSDHYRRQGIGTKLIKSALRHLFSYDSIEVVTLCVEKENEKAIHLYEAAGFNVKHELVDFQVTKPHEK